jgi:hypothetical protein
MVKYWRCPKCHRERPYNCEIMKVCYACQERMEVVDDGMRPRN